MGGNVIRGSDTDGSERERVSDACPLGTFYTATLHIVASVRAPCPTCSHPPCLVRMLNEPFTQSHTCTGLDPKSHGFVTQYRSTRRLTHVSDVSHAVRHRGMSASEGSCVDSAQISKLVRMTLSFALVDETRRYGRSDMSPRSAERAFEEASMTERLVSRLRSIVSRGDTAGSRSLSQSGMGSCSSSSQTPAVRWCCWSTSELTARYWELNSKKRARQSTRNCLSFSRLSDDVSVRRSARRPAGPSKTPRVSPNHVHDCAAVHVHMTHALMPQKSASSSRLTPPHTRHKNSPINRGEVFIPVRRMHRAL